ncbi:MAG: 50S ribosomal protein L18Ae [archaeon]
MKKEKELKKKVFEAKGKLVKKDFERSFSKKVSAFNERNARELVFSLFGSKNKLKRRNILINELKEVKEK